MPKGGDMGLLLALGKPKGEEGAAPESEAEDPMAPTEGLEAAGEEVMNALTAGDAKTFSSALKSFIEICQATDYGDEE